MWGDGPVIFNEKNAESYGGILAKRYARNWNVIWILGGDRPAVYKHNDKDGDDRAIWRAMAKGIEDVLGKEAFITYHPSGGSYFHFELHPRRTLARYECLSIGTRCATDGGLGLGRPGSGDETTETNSGYGAVL